MASHIEPKLKDNPKISIGLPIYNAEQFIKKKFNSILAQTYKNFELIISDNSSTDATRKICEEYARKDVRIRYIHQKKNMGLTWNFNFVLQQANSDYFVWTAVDDIMLPEFLEKNLNILLSKKIVVGCMSEQMVYGIKNDRFKKINTSLKKIGLAFRPHSHFPISGSYEKKVRLFLKKLPWHLFFGVYRTDALRKSYVTKEMVGFDGACILNVLRFGDIDVVNEVLFKSYASGTQSRGMMYSAKQFNKTFMGKIFPYYPLTIYCVKRLGFKVFIKNLDLFLRLNFDGEFLLVVDLLRYLKKSIFYK